MQPNDTFSLLTLNIRGAVQIELIAVTVMGWRLRIWKCLFRWGRVFVYVLRYKEPSQTTCRTTFFIFCKLKQYTPTMKTAHVYLKIVAI